MDNSDYGLVSSYIGLLSLAVISIVAGSFGSISIHKQRKPDGSLVTGADEEDDDEEEVSDRLNAEDAWWFPVLGSVTLFGLYLVVKFLGKEWINWFLGLYFSLAGIASVWKSSISLLRWTMGPQRWRQFDKIKIVATKGSKELNSLSFRTPSLYLLPLAAVPSALYTFPQLLPNVLQILHRLAPTIIAAPTLTAETTRRSALLTDILALSFSHNSLSILKIDSFKTGTILLSGLFLYDIWWVFGTEVMVKVATNLDVPIKLLWPKSTTFSSDAGFTMLGLGDIVVPGIFIALALRYDYYRAATALKGSSSASSSHSRVVSYSKPYFLAAIFAYVAGLSTTMSVMHFFKAAQPALLYLSPACIVSFFATALARGELKEAWAWSDEPPKSPSEIEAEATSTGKVEDKKTR